MLLPMLQAIIDFGRTIFSKESCVSTLRLRHFHQPMTTWKMKQPNLRAAAAGLLAAFCSTAMLADIPANKHGLPVITEIALYQQRADEEPSKQLVDLETFIPGINLDVRYTTETN